MVLAPFGTLERTRTSGLPLRRRSRYPLRYQGLCTMFNFFAIFGGCSYFRLGGGRSIQLSYRGICDFPVREWAAASRDLPAGGQEESC